MSGQQGSHASHHSVHDATSFETPPRTRLARRVTDTNILQVARVHVPSPAGVDSSGTSPIYPAVVHSPHFYLNTGGVSPVIHRKGSHSPQPGHRPRAPSSGPSARPASSDSAPAITATPSGIPPLPLPPSVRPASTEPDRPSSRSLSSTNKLTSTSSSSSSSSSSGTPSDTSGDSASGGFRPIHPSLESADSLRVPVPGPIPAPAPIESAPYTNRLAALVKGNAFEYFDEFALECGATLRDVPVAYKTWGTLNERKDNVLLVCHALTGSADVSDWWAPMLGPGRVFDPSIYFIVCVNMLGSPYGTASPLSLNPESGRPYGPEFPLVTIRDSVRLHKLLLDRLGIDSIEAVVGGSLGGMLVMEWAFLGPDYVKAILPIASTGKHSAWAIAMGETQRLTIFNDPNWSNGYYTAEKAPVIGLANARMQALLTYRSRDAYERKFGRVRAPSDATDGHKEDSGKIEVGAGEDEVQSAAATGQGQGAGQHVAHDHDPGLDPAQLRHPFNVSNYLMYNGHKFTKRFDANCYIRLTQAMDTHDIGRGRGGYVAALKAIKQPAFVLGITSDVLYPIVEQRIMAQYMPRAEMFELESDEGHDGFLIVMELVNSMMIQFLKRLYPHHYSK